MRLSVKVLEEAGYEQSMLGLSFNKKQEVENMPNVAIKLFNKDRGHNKFLEHCMIWLDLVAPRFFWSQFDTYRVGVSKQSESTMHTIMKGHLTQDHFDVMIPDIHLKYLNELIDAEDLIGIKQQLPEGFLQRREVVLSYKVIRHIDLQRAKHRLPHWQKFLGDLREQLKYPELIWTTNRNGANE